MFINVPKLRWCSGLSLKMSSVKQYSSIQATAGAKFYQIVCEKINFGSKIRVPPPQAKWKISHSSGCLPDLEKPWSPENGVVDLEGPWRPRNWLILAMDPEKALSGPRKSPIFLPTWQFFYTHLSSIMPLITSDQVGSFPKKAGFRHVFLIFDWF